MTANHRRVRGERSKKLQRRRSELVERSFAHVCETGGARRCWLHGMLKVSKRYLLQVAARNLGLIMRKLFGMGTPRGLQKEGDLASPAYLLGFVAWCVACLRIRVQAALGRVAESSAHAAGRRSRRQRGNPHFQRAVRRRSTAVNRSLHWTVRWTVRKGRSNSCAAKYWGGDSIGTRISPQSANASP